ncbi:hypothetical protein F0562_017535 [Nyssa sinensis]|uniref:Uncharacterized protein n=1 Tax=Nyssa sinensis TaxID=561372 RepID=A0A5J4ZF08_9ASTE|nr:hypothetical protein F0562_017535 [Nyssa sinensis]
MPPKIYSGQTRPSFPRDPRENGPSRGVRPPPPAQPKNPVKPQDEVLILEEDAVCKNCPDELKEEKAFWMYCSCERYLVHKRCKPKNNKKCVHCSRKVQSFPVTLIKIPATDRYKVKREKATGW